MYKIITVVTLSFLTAGLYAQNPYSLKGSVADTSLNVKLQNTSLMLLNSKDSILVDFTTAGADGSFSLKNLGPGSYILLMVYPDYADHTVRFVLDPSNPFKDLGRISMIPKTRLLQEVLINGTAAIKLKGDTTEFNASSYKIQPNDRVEDLLRQLPGIEVDQNGRITARGKPVQKVLVDGEEFFGDDPTLVTRNIRADMVDKVQLFEKKSDQAAFTGVDDGKRSTTLNVTLKADKKSGYFGKADAGRANDEYYQAQLMYNSFRTKQKFSIYGTLGNTGRTGLSLQENNKYGVTFSMVPAGDLLESFTGRFNGEGIPNAQTGGLHYDAKWNSDKNSVNANYKLGWINVQGDKNSFVRNTLPTGFLDAISAQSSDNDFFRQKIDGVYQLAFNKVTNLTVTMDGAVSHGMLNTSSRASGFRNNTLITAQQRTVRNQSDQKNFNISALLTRKFNKAGRTISLNIAQSVSNALTKGYLYSSNQFVNSSGGTDSVTTVDQYKPSVSDNQLISSNLTYSHPFSKSFSLVLIQGLSFANSSMDSRSFNQSAPGKYNLEDALFSNNFERSLTTNETSAIFKYVHKKVNIQFGTKASYSADKLANLSNNSSYKRDYLIWRPQVVYQYNFTQQKNLYLNYNRSSGIPSINQIQPLRVNTDPLNITIGNTALKPSNENVLIAYFQSYKLNGSGYLLDIYFSSGDHSFVQNTVTDAAGKTTFQTVNLRGRTPYSYNVSLSTGFKSKSGINYSFIPAIKNDTYYRISNGVLNKISSTDYWGSIFVSKSAVKKYNYRLSYSPGYRYSRSSIQGIPSNSGWYTTTVAAATVYLPGKMLISSNVNHTFWGKTQTFNNDFNRVLLGASITKNFLKRENLSLTLSGNDLLNQNNGFTRMPGSINVFSQNEYTTIKRYFMLSLLWDFLKSAK